MPEALNRVLRVEGLAWPNSRISTGGSCGTVQADGSGRFARRLALTLELGAGGEADVPAAARVVADIGAHRDGVLEGTDAERGDEPEQRHADGRPDAVGGD